WRNPCPRQSGHMFSLLQLLLSSLVAGHESNLVAEKINNRLASRVVDKPTRTMDDVPAGVRPTNSRPPHPAEFGNGIK
ncbi:MAG: hypothetical protein P8175_18400, partial [Deltaproteobacteria bacterium]